MRKKIIFSFLATSLVLFFTACDEEKKYATVDFEDISLDSTQVHKTSAFTSGAITFANAYTADWDYYEGFAASAKTDMETAGFTNDLSVYTTSAASGKQFAVIYKDNASCSFDSNTEYIIRDIKLNNNTYAYLSMKNGDLYSKKFVTNDWFKITIFGHNKLDVKLDSIDFYLADFRDGKAYICDKWTTVNLEKLGLINKLSFSFSSTDNGEWGMNTPAYACIDDITYILPE